MNIAIIGGSGFIGTRLCARFEENNAIDYVIIDIATSAAYPHKWRYGDLRDEDSLRKALNGKFDIVINLAAEHKDNIQPKVRYYETNENGQDILCKIMDEFSIEKLIFTSSVAVYGFVTEDTDESGKIAPFHAYGDSKYKAEMVAEKWYAQKDNRQLSVIRPTVVFGEGNRGNVYNLLRQIASRYFLIIGSGNNKKSMAYVENVVAFIEFLTHEGSGHQVINYVDKPDFDMNSLVNTVNVALGKTSKTFHLPYWIGLMIGHSSDILSKITKREFPISSIRVKKFCARTQFKTSTNYLGFKQPYNLTDGIERTVKHEFR